MSVNPKPTRSGYQVAGTAFAAGSVTSLLSPWINEWVRHVSSVTGVSLDMAYSDQVLGLTVAVISWSSSQIKMWWLERADKAQNETDDIQRFADAEIGRLTAELETLRRSQGTLGLSTRVTHTDIEPKV